MSDDCVCGHPESAHGEEHDVEEVPTGHYPAYGDGMGGLVYGSEMAVSQRDVTWYPCTIGGCVCDDFEAAR
jgi:hypothetical protein